MSLLFTPHKIGTLNLPNRIIRSATAERMADDITGLPLATLKACWQTLAVGGCGLIISGHMYVHPSGKCHPEMTGIYSDEHIAPLHELTTAVHQIGGLVAAQINHGGMQCEPDCVPEPIAPSAIQTEFLSQPATEISLAEIEMLIDAFAQAARRAKAAGFDAVQMHAAHGYLINQFISPFTNRRSDEWGGDLHGRTRFLREVAPLCANRWAKPTRFHQIRYAGRPLGWLDCCRRRGSGRDDGNMGLDGVEISGGLRASNSKRGINQLDREAYFRPSRSWPVPIPVCRSSWSAACAVTP